LRTYVYDVPEGTDVSQILVTLYEPRDQDVPDNEWKPDERIDVAVRGGHGYGVRVWGPPLDLAGKA